MIDFEQYVKDVTRTESHRPIGSVCDMDRRTMHAAFGLVTESGELLDMLKKYLFYGKIFDRTNLIEELGDLTWYLGIMCDANGIDLQDVFDRNIAKLKARYPEKFTEEAAINRDLDNERKVLEKA